MKQGVVKCKSRWNIRHNCKGKMEVEDCKNKIVHSVQVNLLPFYNAFKLVDEYRIYDNKFTYRKLGQGLKIKIVITISQVFSLYFLINSLLNVLCSNGPTMH